MSYKLSNCEQVLLKEIANRAFKRMDIARTYALATKSSEFKQVDWVKVNEAIVKRWSLSGLEYIKNLAWTGKCWKNCGSRPVGE